MRSKETKEQALKEKFLIQLEALALEKEARIVSLKRKRKSHQYFQDLMAVLTKSKIGFAEDFEEGSVTQKEEFEEYLSELIEDQSKREQIISEIKNLAFLSKKGIINHEEVKTQRKTALETLDLLMAELEKFLEKNPLASTERKIEYLESYLQNIVALGSCYEDYSSPHEIEDIDFFQEVIEKVILSDDEKNTLIMHALTNNVTNYQEDLIADDSMIEELDPQENASSKTFLDEKLEMSEDPKPSRFTFEDTDALLEEMLKTETPVEQPKQYK